MVLSLSKAETGCHCQGSSQACCSQHREPVPFIARLELGEQGRPPPLRLHDRPRREVGSKIPGMMLVLQQRHVLQEQTHGSSSGCWELTSKHRTTQKTPCRYSFFEALGREAQCFALPRRFPVSPSSILHWNGSSALYSISSSLFLGMHRQGWLLGKDPSKPNPTTEHPHANFWHPSSPDDNCESKSTNR